MEFAQAESKRVRRFMPIQCCAAEHCLATFNAVLRTEEAHFLGSQWVPCIENLYSWRDAMMIFKRAFQVLTTTAGAPGTGA